MTHHLVVLLLLSFTLLNAQPFDGVIGCGGFVEYAPDIANIITKQIDYSVIQVRLLTSEGVVKEHTECAPNGYYYLPIERRGSYVIQIEGPSGWTFEPKEVAVQIGSDNECRPVKGGATGQDINFYFTGFTISGKVVGDKCPEVRSSSGRIRGPKGIGITLHSLEKAEIPKRYTETDASGMYFFSNVFPGRYSLTATHGSLKLSQNRAEVTMEWDNLVVPTPFIVSGYDLSGSVNSGSDPVSDVDFVLYSAQPLTIDGCHLGAYSATKDGQHPVCTAQSNTKGQFVFKSIPCGSYNLVPHYKGNNTSFDVSPSTVNVSINMDSVTISEPFRVVGFSIFGKVVDAQGEPMSQVTISVDGKERTQSAADGSFKLDQMTSGAYKIDAKKEHYYFDERQVRVVPNVPLAPFSPSQYDICGSILITNPAGASKRSNTVVLKDQNGRQIRQETFDTPNFCLKKNPPGVYTVEPLLSSSESSSGFMLTPSSIKVTVSNAPVFGVTFSQSRLTLGGKVECLNGPCPSTLSVQLADAGKHQSTTYPNNGVYLFKDVVPGAYQVSVTSDQPLCWDHSTQNIEVRSENMTGIDFHQNGYLVQVNTRHSLELVVSQGSQVNTFIVEEPSDTFCLPKSGVYDVRPVSCFQFEKDIFTYDTTAPKTLSLVPQKYKVIGHLRVEGSPVDLKVNLKIKTPQGERTVTVVPSETNTEGNSTIYEYSHWASLQDDIVVQPSAKDLLFYPSSRTVHITRDECPPPTPSIDGRPALFKKGQVSPGVSGVRVVAVKADGTEAAETVTNEKGQYSLGPLYDTFSYSVKAEKLGYNLEQSGTSGNFEAFKLSHVTVTVSEGSSAVGGVLISMSGASFRSNNVTSPSGKFTFYGLKPGKYFARPLLKEYSFEPSSQTVEVEDGKDVDVVFKAKRNAFSCYGNLSTLTGEALSHAVIEAVGPNGEYEEAESDQFGRYRIRGLLPGVRYEIGLKNTEVGAKIERTIPKTHSVQVSSANVENINFLVFHQVETFSLTGVIRTEGDWLSSLVVTLSPPHDPEQVIKRVSMGPSEFFRIPQIQKGKYLLKVYSTFPSEFYALPTVQQSVEVHGNSERDHLTLTWLPTEQSQELAGSSGSPIFGLLFGLLVLYCAFNMKKVRLLIDSILKGTLLQRAEESRGSLQDWIPAHVQQQAAKLKKK